MRIIFFLFLMMTVFALVAQAQSEKPPTTAEMQAQLQKTIQEAKQQIVEIKQQIAEAKKNKDDPESINQMEKQLESLQQMVSMLEKTTIPGNKTPKTLPPSKNSEPPYVSPFTPITIKQSVKPPTKEQSTDQLLWYRGKKIDANTIITPTGLIVRHDPQRNIVIWQPDKKDTTYYGLVNTLGKTRQLKTDYSSRMESMMNSYFMFPLIEDAYEEYEVFKTRFYELAKNSVQLPQKLVVTQLETDIKDFLKNFLDWAGPTKAPPPPKRPNDLCLCDDLSKRNQYENELRNWAKDFFADEKKLIWDLQKILSHIHFNKRNNYYIPGNAEMIEQNYVHYFTQYFNRMGAKLEILANQYEGGEVLVEDGMVLAWMAYLTYTTELDKSIYSAAASVAETLTKIKNLVQSNIFEAYIEEQKNIKNFNAVFDFGLYASHELNKAYVNGHSNVNKNLYDEWMKGLEKFNRFKLNIEIDFDFQQVDRENNDKVLLIANGLLKSDEMIVSLGRHDCNWELYLKDINHRNRNTSGEEFKIPMSVVSGSKDIIDDKYPPFPYSGPPKMRLIFPTFKISFCNDQSAVMMDILSYDAADILRHKNDDIARKYTIDMLFFATKVFISAGKTQLNVDELIRTSVNMMNIQSSQLPSSSGDPAFDRLKMDYLMNKKKYELQYSLSQTTHTGKTVIPLTLDPPGSSRLFLPSVDLADPDDPDREKGMMLIKGIVKLKVEHSP